jgi:hypothetical protein
MNRPDLDRADHPRTVLVKACAVSILLAVASLSWWYAASRERLVVSERTVHAAPTPIAVSDCPPSATCRPDGTVRPVVLALVRARFGPDSITGSSAVMNLQSGARYEEFIQARIAPGVEVQVTTRCVIGGSTPTSIAPSSVPSNGPASLVAVVAGRGGCSAAVAMQVSSGTAVPWTRASDLVNSPSLQLED